MALQPSDWAWVSLVTGIATYEVRCKHGQYMSDASSRYRRAQPILWPAVICLVAGHLLEVIPERFDPIHRLASLKREEPAHVDT